MRERFLLISGRCGFNACGVSCGLSDKKALCGAEGRAGKEMYGKEQDRSYDRRYPCLRQCGRKDQRREKRGDQRSDAHFDRLFGIMFNCVICKEHNKKNA